MIALFRLEIARGRGNLGLNSSGMHRSGQGQKSRKAGLREKLRKSVGGRKKLS